MGIKSEDMFEVRFHGRGGQGAVTASKILALASFNEGKYVMSFPFFGTERRGAPVTSFTRIDEEPILLKTQIYHPDAIVVLDPYVFKTSDVTEGIKEGGYVIINSRKSPEEYSMPFNVATVDAISIAMDLGLGDRTNPIINTAMLGAFSKATGVVSLEHVMEATRMNSPKKGEENAEAVKRAYELLRIGR